MWEVEIACRECGGTHAVHAELSQKPRAFSFVCPATSSLVAIRYRDPSVLARPWAEVASSSPRSIPVSSAETGGALDV